ncbi:MAG TPA: response regulator transcription factor [Labilithrix sp.]|nr:response regulator transcription factor [Labilithrix sp.]
MKVLLVDDHKIIRDGLRAILEKHATIEVVGEAADGHEALEVARIARPDVVVMDVSMRGLNGIDATARFVRELPGIKVLGLSMNSDRRYVMAMLAAGAVGYVLKDAPSDELVRALRTVAEGQTYLSPAISGIVIERAVNASLPAATRIANELSTREREVLQLLAEGRTSKEIGARLHIAMTTVESHRRQIMSKLKLRSVAELTKYAIREGLTPLG